MQNVKSGLSRTDKKLGKVKKIVNYIKRAKNGRRYSDILNFVCEMQDIKAARSFDVRGVASYLLHPATKDGIFDKYCVKNSITGKWCYNNLTKTLW